MEKEKKELESDSSEKEVIKEKTKDLLKAEDIDAINQLFDMLQMTKKLRK